MEMLEFLQNDEDGFTCTLVVISHDIVQHYSVRQACACQTILCVNKQKIATKQGTRINQLTLCSIKCLARGTSPPKVFTQYGWSVYSLLTICKALLFTVTCLHSWNSEPTAILNKLTDEICAQRLGSPHFTCDTLRGGVS